MSNESTVNGKPVSTVLATPATPATLVAKPKVPTAAEYATLKANPSKTAADVEAIKAYDGVQKAKAKKEAKLRVLQFVKDNADSLKGIADDIRSLIGTGATRASVGVKGINSDLRDAFLTAGDKGLTEMDIFKAFHIGRPEMVTKIRILVLCPNVADRVWVKFNEQTETYHVVGTGAKAPADWTGYNPDNTKVL